MCGGSHRRVLLDIPRLLVLLTVWGVAAGCILQDERPVAEARRQTADQAVVYGEDDRTDWYAHSDEALRNLTSQSIVALIPMHMVDESDPDQIRIEAPTLGEQFNLCPGERFADQPTAAACSATLIDDDLVLTAGHCVVLEALCYAYRLVFHYYMASEDDLAPITADEVFHCEELVVEADTLVSGDLDYAIIRLDRPATPRFVPAPVHTEDEPLENGEPVVLIGFPNGLPAKIEDGGRVTRTGSQDLTTFDTTSDAFQGNSGSGVFNQAGEVVGILVTGVEDYRAEGDCNVVNVMSESHGYEGATYVHRAIEALCETGYPSERLCGVANVCGDGFCLGDETRDTCPRDCLPGFRVPDQWVCQPDAYHALDRCDCECGAYDPDCDRAELEVANCPPGVLCNQAGECEIGEEEPEQAEELDASQSDLPDAGEDPEEEVAGDAEIDPLPATREESDSGCQTTAFAPSHGAASWLGLCLVALIILSVLRRMRALPSTMPPLSATNRHLRIQTGIGQTAGASTTRERR